MEGISKQFADFYANKDISFDVRAGEVHTLLGENGAGKSTLMNILFGLYQPTAGRIFYKGEEVKIDSPAHAVRLGIGMVHQHFMLIEAMSAFENIILGDKKQRGLFIDRAARRKEIEALSALYRLEVDLDAQITDMSVGTQQRVEILKALYRGAEVLVLDEPTAVLTDQEAEGLFDVVRRLTDEGKSIIFISHKMREVLKISDRITVLRAGEVVRTVARGEEQAEGLARLMIGRELARSDYPHAKNVGDAVISLESVSYNKESKHAGVRGISLAVRRGEIVGIAGVDGNGQSQLAQIMTGVLAPDEGQVALMGKPVGKFTVKTFLGERVAHVPEDRTHMGLFGGMNVRENILIKQAQAESFSAARGLFLKKDAMRRYTDEMREKYDIRCDSLDQEIRNLSGGNQQKVILARELEDKPDLLVAVHPTRGLDIGATRFVHDAMIEARENGGGILLISSDLDEILEMSDRILVLFEGEVMGEFDGVNPPIDEISLALAGNRKEVAV
ncbi:MAG: ABC transporter ATP-binding protein [Clostridiales Family XIII bacterium]|jgi:simple sugar transport system ATP-binding protein|nr:ABC transporter ATP-binding protein [Clostridiales Family XIII bacterium]